MMPQEKADLILDYILLQEKNEKIYVQWHFL